jgi:hypothetical protein
MNMPARKQVARACHRINSPLVCKVMSQRTKEGGIFQKILVFINDLQIGDKVSGMIFKLFRSRRFPGQISGALVKIGDRISDVGFIPGRYLNDWNPDEAERRKKLKFKHPSHRNAHSQNGLDVGDVVLAEVIAINPQVESYESEIIIRPIEMIARGKGRS